MKHSNDMWDEKDSQIVCYNTHLRPSNCILPKTIDSMKLSAIAFCKLNVQFSFFYFQSIQYEKSDIILKFWVNFVFEWQNVNGRKYDWILKFSFQKIPSNHKIDLHNLIWLLWSDFTAHLSPIFNWKNEIGPSVKCDKAEDSPLFSYIHLMWINENFIRFSWNSLKKMFENTIRSLMKSVTIEENLAFYIAKKTTIVLEEIFLELFI